MEMCIIPIDRHHKLPTFLTFLGYLFVVQAEFKWNMSKRSSLETSWIQDINIYILMNELPYRKERPLEACCLYHGLTSCIQPKPE